MIYLAVHTLLMLAIAIWAGVSIWRAHRRITDENRRALAALNRVHDRIDMCAKQSVIKGLLNDNEHLSMRIRELESELAVLHIRLEPNDIDKLASVYMLFPKLVMHYSEAAEHAGLNTTAASIRASHSDLAKRGVLEAMGNGKYRLRTNTGEK